MIDISKSKVQVSMSMQDFDEAIAKASDRGRLEGATKSASNILDILESEIAGYRKTYYNGLKDGNADRLDNLVVEIRRMIDRLKI